MVKTFANTSPTVCRRASAPRRRWLAFVAAVGAAAAACNGDRAFAPGVDPNAPVAGGYSSDDVLYFHEVVGGPTGTTSVRKWGRDVRVAISGEVTDVDRANLDHVCAAITAAIGGPVRVSRDTTGTANVSIVFGPRSLVAGLDDALHEYVIGSADVGEDAPGRIDTATISIAAELEGGYRLGAIRHELTHAMGMPGHTQHFPSSTMTPLVNGLADYTSVDADGIEMLYRDEVKVGMTPLEAQHVLSALPRRGR